MAKLKGKVAMVNGCAKKGGFGRAVARRLAAEGAAVVITDIDQSGTVDGAAARPEEWQGLASICEEIRAQGGAVTPLTLDVRSSTQVDAAFTQVKAEYGGLDIILNNFAAPIGPDRLPVVDVTEEAWDVVINTNLKGVFLCCRAAATLMIEGKRDGRILNTSSDLGKVGLASRAAYCASKFGIIGFTQSLAMELAPRGITVNAICPGSGATDRLHYLGRDAKGRLDPKLRDEMIAEKSSAIPIGRLVKPEDVADLVAFLASDEAKYITGQAVNLSGGVIMH